MKKSDTVDTHLTFDKSARNFILEAFGKTVDDEGYVVEAEQSRPRVLTKDGQEIKADEFAGVMKGSEIYIKSDIVSLVELSDTLHKV